MLLKIIEYPDNILRKKSLKVEVFDKKFHNLLDGMNDAMQVRNGIGLAAVQVAKLLQALIINIPLEDEEQDEENLLEVVNPVIISKEGEIIYQEGCLSIPSFYEDVNRFEFIKLQYQDRYGNQKYLEADGLLSIALQHEIDHLNGILFIDKLSYSRRKKFEKEYKRLQKEKKSSK